MRASMLLVTLAACRLSLDVQTETKITCSTNAECPSGWACQETLALCVEASRYDSEPPRVVSVGASAVNLVVIAFSEPMTGLDAVSNYLIADGALAIDGITVSESAQSVILHTSAQAPEVSYLIDLSAMRDLAGRPISEPLRVEFAGFGVADRIAPKVISISVPSREEVVVSFSEPVLHIDALASYSVAGPSGPLGVLGATVSADAQSVSIATSQQKPEDVYALTLTGIIDTAGNTLAEPVSIAFSGFGVADRTNPTLINVVAAHSAGVIVQFSEPIVAVGPLLDSVSITGLTVLDAFLSSDARSVVLTTAPQLPGGSYTVMIDDVVDAASNPLQPLLSSAMFLGYGVPETDPPKQLSPLKGLLIDPVSIDLVWTARSGAASYTVEIATDSTFDSVIVTAVVPGEQTSLRLPNVSPPLPALLADVTYFWRVRASHTELAFTTGIPATDMAAYPSDYFDIVRDAVLVGCPSGTGCVPGSPVGNQCKPYRSIGAGIGAARVHGLAEVRVQGCGTDAFIEQVDVANGVSLRGGYDATFTSADPLTSKSRIVSSSISVLTAANITIPTVVDGFEIADLAGGTALSAGYGIYVSRADTLTLSRVTVLPRGVIARSTGIYIGASATSAPLGFGVLLADCSVTADDVADYGGDATLAIQIEDSSVVLRNNTLRGGSAATSSARFGDYTASAMSILGSKVEANRNTFYGGNLLRSASTPAGTPALGFGSHASRAITAFQSTLRMTNNLIESGTFSREIGASADDGGAWGIYAHSPVGTSLYANNTILLHSTDCSSVRGMYIQGRHDIINNLIVAEPNTVGAPTELTGYSEISFTPAPPLGGYAPASFFGNVISGFATCPYRRYTGVFSCLTATAPTGLTTHHATMGTPSAYNTFMVGPAGAAAVGFVNLSSTGGGGDYHLGPSAPTSVVGAGIDASLDVCGLLGTSSCGAVQLDRDGASRDCAAPGTDCYSVGAYERN